MDLTPRRIREIEGSKAVLSKAEELEAAGGAQA